MTAELAGHRHPEVTLPVTLDKYALTSTHLNHIQEELGLDVQKAHKTALKLRAYSVLYAHTDALLKNPVTLEVLV